MPGVKGSGGPVPKRSDQRRRTNTPAAGPTKKAAGATNVAVPRPDPKWHPVAKRWLNSLARSGQAQFFEPSDWATAYLLAESMSRELNPQPIVIGKGDTTEIEMQSLPPKAASLAAWLKGAAALLATEGDRRRLAIELERPRPAGEGEGDADVPHLDDARRRLRGAG